MTTRARVEALFGEDEFDAWMVWLVQSAVLIRNYSQRAYCLRRTLAVDVDDVW